MEDTEAFSKTTLQPSLPYAKIQQDLEVKGTADVERVEGWGTSWPT